MTALRENLLANQIEWVKDGAEALEYLERRGAHAGRPGGDPCVVLLDLKLPKVDGLEVLRAIKASATLRSISRSASDPGREAVPRRRDRARRCDPRPGLPQRRQGDQRPLVQRQRGVHRLGSRDDPSPRRAPLGCRAQGIQGAHPRQGTRRVGHIPRVSLPGMLACLDRRTRAAPADTLPVRPAAVLGGIEVRAYRSIEALLPSKQEIDALNRASRRPCPFASFEYVRAFQENDESSAEGDELLWLCGFREGTLVGYLPLKRTHRHILGRAVPAIELLVWHDTDRPHLVARVDDEPPCAAAFLEYLTRHERWAVIELLAQDEGSALSRLPPLPSWRYYVRRYEIDPNTTIPLQQSSLREFYQGLSGDFRSTVSRMSRRLLQAGRVETLSCHDVRARRPLLDLYLAVERRSWKEAAGAGITRHPRRLGLFRSLCSPEQALQLAYDFVFLDGVPIAGIMSGIFEGGFYALETTYDEACGKLSPGYLTWLLGIRHGMRAQLRSYNLQSAYSYYKSRWNGVSTPTWSVQIYRIPGLPFLHARAGELKRALLRRGPEAPTTFNEVKRSAKEKVQPSTEHPSRTAEAEAAAAVLAQLERQGVQLERLEGPALLEALPFANARQGPGCTSAGSSR
jgi:hypothetical protein